MFQKLKVLTTKYAEFSRRTVVWGIVLIASLSAASFVDLAGLLEYFKIVRGATHTTLETGAIISMACAIPFLAMGMSITDDGYRNK